MRYDAMLVRAWHIVWGRPWLWLLAAFAGESGASSGRVPSFVPTPGRPGSASSADGRSGTAPWPFDQFGWIPGWVATHLWLLFEVTLGMLVATLLLAVASAFLEAALVRGIAEIDEGTPQGLGDAWRGGARRGLAVLGVRLLLILPVLAALALIALPLAVAIVYRQPAWALVLLLAIPVALLILLVTALLVPLATRAAVLELAGPATAIGRALELVRRRPWRVLGTFGLQIAIGIAAGLAGTVLVGLVEVPITGPVAGAYSSHDLPALLRWLGILLAVGVLLRLAVNSLVGAYVSAVWTLAYRRFDLEPTAPPEPPLPPLRPAPALGSSPG